MSGAPRSAKATATANTTGREHELLRLVPGSTVSVDGAPRTVRGAIQIRGATQRWAEYLLEAGTPSLWLAVEELADGGVRLSRWTRTTADAAGFDPLRPVLHGVPLVETERGEGDFEAAGEFGADGEGRGDGLGGLTPGRGRLDYIDFAGPGVRASLERFVPGAPGLLGIGTDLPAPGDRTDEHHA
ncbi:DUF4178 domain-containing protein [Streptomyces sp. SR27]|uniref:DUF4178 domain-containing protein n=1 Tax=unclassified Streptomyces TaxID=2593676 RepID=UPI00295AE587|nr:DUF4178 domain-containing protein [Streptomyces sp. SR27]MDV9189685.1 DUF4178 domain-containing protein [Streptomyces sp. SR27]